MIVLCMARCFCTYVEQLSWLRCCSSFASLGSLLRLHWRHSHQSNEVLGGHLAMVIRVALSSDIGDAQAPLKLKTNTWNNEFIDFGLLLANQFAKGKYQSTINPGDGYSPCLALEPVTKPKKIVSRHNWVHVSVDVFTGCFPCNVPGLMKYGSTMQDLPKRGHNWRFHDENFRFLRQAPATSLP